MLAKRCYERRWSPASRRPGVQDKSVPEGPRAQERRWAAAAGGGEGGAAVGQQDKRAVVDGPSETSLTCGGRTLRRFPCFSATVLLKQPPMRLLHLAAPTAPTAPDFMRREPGPACPGHPRPGPVFAAFGMCCSCSVRRSGRASKRKRESLPEGMEPTVAD